MPPGRRIPGMDPPSLSSVRRLRRAASPEKQPRADDATLESAIVGATDDVAQILRHDAHAGLRAALAEGCSASCSSWMMQVEAEDAATSSGRARSAKLLSASGHHSSSDSSSRSRPPGARSCGRRGDEACVFRGGCRLPSATRTGAAARPAVLGRCGASAPRYARSLRLSCRTLAPDHRMACVPCSTGSIGSAQPQRLSC